MLLGGPCYHQAPKAESLQKPPVLPASLWGGKEANVTPIKQAHGTTFPCSDWLDKRLAGWVLSLSVPSHTHTQVRKVQMVKIHVLFTGLTLQG